ncbi:MAG: trypsin-like peptidase domain-containing protein [Acidobacteria bacterium]|nr:trypsin-like peptidase domain-containing protein [Acidobacteriota bacterium]
MQLLAIGPGARDKKQECAATGFLVNDDGYILTNAHVIEDARRCLTASPEAKIVAKFGPGDGRSVEAVACNIVAVDEDRDLAVLKTESALPDAQRGKFLRLSPVTPPVDTQVWVTGHPSFLWQSKTYLGRVIARESVRLNGKNGPRTDVLILDIPLKRGASGSPVYLDSGEVVGIVESQRASNRLQTVAVQAVEAIRFLEDRGIH